MATVKPSRNANKPTLTAEDKLRVIVNQVSKMAAKLYPCRYAMLYIKCDQPKPNKIDQTVYQLFTAPKDDTTIVQLVQEGQLASMRRYLIHELEMNLYHNSAVAYRDGKML